MTEAVKTMRRSTRIGLLTLLSALVCLPAVGFAPQASGQDRAERSRGERSRGERSRGARAEAEILEGEEEDIDQDVDSDMRTEGGEKVKVFRFSGLDLAGRLKSPQLLYFLNRMRAEFDRPRLPHRTFIPELQRSAQGKAFR